MSLCGRLEKGRFSIETRGTIIWSKSAHEPTGQCTVVFQKAGKIYIYKAHYWRHPHGNKSHNVESWGFMSSCLVVCKLYACMSSFSSSWLPGAHNWKALQSRSLHERCAEHFCWNNWIIRYVSLFISFGGGGNDVPVKYQPTLQQLWRWHKHLDHFSSISVEIQGFSLTPLAHMDLQ